MWTNQEFLSLEKCLHDVKLDHILTEEEIEVIKLNSTRYSSLKSEILVPKHNREVCSDSFTYSKFTVSE